ncbi:MAG: hypothetical protein HRT89_10200 [Lentisphaeria bacterium]|nr:hypothetical protein [Lentisphaeria bacterium]NQZ68428.1 hypothetical protein [Lentisphaeria bacterium]
MLKELLNCRQIDGEPRRRWFTDDDFDLIIWYTDDEVYGFQLCYDKTNSERAFTWVANKGFSHQRVDTGEMYGFGPDNFIPILVPDGIFDAEKIAGIFREKSAELDSPVVELVLSKLNDY